MCAGNLGMMLFINYLPFFVINEFTPGSTTKKKRPSSNKSLTFVWFERISVNSLKNYTFCLLSTIFLDEKSATTTWKFEAYYLRSFSNIKATIFQFEWVVYVSSLENDVFHIFSSFRFVINELMPAEQIKLIRRTTDNKFQN